MHSIIETFIEYFCQIPSKSIHVISSYTISELGSYLRHSVVVAVSIVETEHLSTSVT